MKYSLMAFLIMCTLHSMENPRIKVNAPPKSPINKIKHVNDVLSFCFYLAKKLDEQPVVNPFDREKTFDLPHNVNDIIHCTIFDLMNSLANTTIFQKKVCDIHSCANFSGFSIFHCPSGCNNKCNINELEKRYQVIIDEIKRGWKNATPQDYPKSHYLDESEEEFVLFVKSNYLSKEGLNLIFTLGKIRLNISLRVFRNKEKNETYLWVKKDSLEKFYKLLGFEIQ